jgi:hypothetical protein
MTEQASVGEDASAQKRERWVSILLVVFGLAALETGNPVAQ